MAAAAFAASLAALPIRTVFPMAAGRSGFDDALLDAIGPTTLGAVFAPLWGAIAAPIFVVLHRALRG